MWAWSRRPWPNDLELVSDCKSRPHWREARGSLAAPPATEWQSKLCIWRGVRVDNCRSLLKDLVE